VPNYGDSLPTLQPLSDYERMRLRNNHNSDEQLQQKQQQHNFQYNNDTWNTPVNNVASGMALWGVESMNKALQQQQQQQMAPIEQRNTIRDSLQQLWTQVCFIQIYKVYFIPMCFPMFQAANTGQVTQYSQIEQNIWSAQQYDLQRSTTAATTMNNAASSLNNQQNYLSLMRQNNNNNTMNTNTREPSVVDASTTSGLPSTANVGSA
jgi:hypothetical protein